jgi:hypothetical protein
VRQVASEVRSAQHDCDGERGGGPELADGSRRRHEERQQGQSSQAVPVKTRTGIGTRIDRSILGN